VVKDALRAAGYPVRDTAALGGSDP